MLEVALRLQLNVAVHNSEDDDDDGDVSANNSNSSSGGGGGGTGALYETAVAEQLLPVVWFDVGGSQPQSILDDFKSSVYGAIGK